MPEQREFPNPVCNRRLCWNRVHIGDGVVESSSVLWLRPYLPTLLPVRQARPMTSPLGAFATVEPRFWDFATPANPSRFPLPWPSRFRQFAATGKVVFSARAPLLSAVPYPRPPTWGPSAA